MRTFIRNAIAALFLAFSRTLKEVNLESREQLEAIERAFHREKKRLSKRKYNNRKYKKRQKYREKFHALRGAQAKDHRYSNQRTLRRMFTNM